MSISSPDWKSEEILAGKKHFEGQVNNLHLLLQTAQ